MTKKTSLLIPAFFIVMGPYVYTMDKKETAKPAASPQITQIISPHSESLKDGSVLVNITLPTTPHQQHPSSSDTQTHHKHPSISVTAPENPQLPGVKTSNIPKSDSVILQIEMPDIADATPAEMKSIINDVIHQISLEMFGSYDETSFYVKELKASLLESFAEYKKLTQAASSSSSSSSCSDTSSDTGSDQHYQVSKQHKNSKIAAQQIALAKLRHGVCKHLDSRQSLRQSSGGSSPAAASAQTILPTDEKAHKDLKEWFLRELELHDLKMRENEKDLKEKAASSNKELEDTRFKAKLAIFSTVVSTACGAVTTILTYLLTAKKASQGSNQ